jgi:hypothetical protein
MAEFLDRVLDTVPEKGGPRKTLKWVLGALVVAALAVWARDAADARIMRKTRPLRIRVGETSAIIDHVFEDLEDQRQFSGLPKHSLNAIREEGRKRALAEEKEDHADGE